MLCFVPELLGLNRNELLVIKNFLDQIKMFCSHSDNKRTKSKCFASICYFFGLNRNFLLCLSQFPDQIKLLCFVPELLGQKGNALLAENFFWYQIKMFCFRSDSKLTKSKRFAFVPIISFDIETFVLSFRYR